MFVRVKKKKKMMMTINGLDFIDKIMKSKLLLVNIFYAQATLVTSAEKMFQSWRSYYIWTNHYEIKQFFLLNNITLIKKLDY